MIRQGDVIGAIALARGEVAAFSDAHVELLKTFADQAVIAIENVRLFKELEARNRDLTEPRAADGDERDPARHQPVADRRPAGVRHHRGERGAPLRRGHEHVQLFGDGSMHLAAVEAVDPGGRRGRCAALPDGRAGAGSSGRRVRS